MLHHNLMWATYTQHKLSIHLCGHRSIKHPTTRMALHLRTVATRTIVRARLTSGNGRAATYICMRSFATAQSNATPGDKPTPSTDATTTPSTDSTTNPLNKPIKNMRDVMEALDILVEEAEKKMEKKYRPNMFAEFKQLNDTEGKVLVGAPQLIKVDKAHTVPSLQVSSLVGTSADIAQLVAKNGKHATLVLTSFKNYGLDMLPAWRDPFLKEFVNQNVQVVTLNVIEDWYMKLVQGSIINGLKAKTPEALYDATYAYFGRCDDFRTVLDLNNSFVGYVHLVDGHGRIRWIAGGPATSEELQRLVKLTRELLVQQKQSSKQRR